MWVETKDLEEVVEFMNVVGVSRDEALAVLIGAFSPPYAGTIHNNWIKSKTYGHSAPDTKVIRKLLDDSDYRCSKCGSQRRLSLHHKDGCPTNHEEPNLQVLCFSCNRATSARPTSESGASNIRVYRAVMGYLGETGKVPSLRQACVKGNIIQLGTGLYLIKFLQKRLQSFLERQKPGINPEG